MQEKMLGPYRIEKRLGAGGMGEVFRASDTRLGRDVALKLLPPAQAGDETARARLVREAQTCSSLNHPYICTIYEVGESEGQTFIAMEHVEGRPLSALISSDGLPVDTVLRYGGQIAEALGYAHDRGIVHRDLKTGNVMVTPEGRVKVLDFGLAKRLTQGEVEEATKSQMSRTEAGAIVGTFHYLAPELLGGGASDARSDIWALGVVLYQMATGRLPFQGRSPYELSAAILRESLKPLPPSLPPGLNAVIQCCLAKEPGQRYQRASEIRAALEAIGSQTAIAPIVVQAARRPLAAYALGAGIFAVLLLAATLVWWRGRTSPVPVRAEFEALTNFADSATSPAISPDGRMLAFIRGENTFVGPGEIYVKLLPHGEPKPLTNDGTAKMSPEFTPDGDRIAYTVDTRDTWTVPVLSGPPSPLLANASALTWIPHGTGRAPVLFCEWLERLHMSITTSSESRAELRRVYVPENKDGMVHYAYLSPDQKSVLAVEMDLDGWLPCRLVPFDGSSRGKQVGPAPAQCVGAAWSPDGKWMYVSANAGNGFHIWRQRFPDGVPEQVTSGVTEEKGLAFAPDGRSFVTAVGLSQSTLWVHDARGDRQITSTGYAFLPSLSPDGRKLYYLMRSGVSRRFVSGELWAANLETGQQERLLPDLQVEHFNVSADGTRVVMVAAEAEGRAPVWVASLDGRFPPRQLTTLHSIRVFFGPRGDFLFVGGERGAPFLYRIREDGTGLEKVIPTPVTYLYSMSPDGKWLGTWEGTSVMVRPLDGGPPKLICTECGTAGEENRGVTPPMVSWSPDQKYVYLHFPMPSRRTYAIALRPGQILPPLPASGVQPKDAGALPGARPIPQQRAFGGSSPTVYAYPRVTTQRNIYRVTVP